MPEAAFIYDDKVSRHVLREDHPMRPMRLRTVYELLEAYGAFDAVPAMPPRSATKEELLWFHTEEYVDAVKSISDGDALFRPARYNFSATGDNPPYEGMYEAAALSTGGSLVAAELVASGKVDVAFNIAGGLHHAAKGHASGFCTFNDPVIAIEYLRRRGLRVAYIDIDCHHGDGVQAAYYDSAEVLTVSLHESGRYLFPGTGEVAELGEGRGEGYSLNVPLAPYTTDEVYEEAFEAAVVPVVEAFKPDVIVGQLGMDTHFDDPLTHVALTVEGHARIMLRVAALARRWVALGGGGYDLSATARGWALDYGLMQGREWSDEIPARFSAGSGIKRLRDGRAPRFSKEVQERSRRFAHESVAQVRAGIFPLHGLGQSL